MRSGSRLSIARVGVVIACLLTYKPLLAQVTGQWEFNGNLGARVGGDGSYWSLTRDVALETQFGTTSSFGISDIGGQPAKVMRFPQNDAKMGYAMFPQIDANGGGGYVNQYTIVMDLLFPASSSTSWRAIFQTNDCNSNFAEFYVSPSNGIGVNFVYDGVFTPDTWHRLTVTVDLTQPIMGKYIDGVKVADQTTGLDVLDGTFSLWTKNHNLPTLLFTDNADEEAPGYVNSIQIRNYAMSAAEVAALGGPNAAGIPGGTGVTGQWDFDAGDLRATTGLALEYFKGCPPRECTQDLPAETHFGTASSFGLPRIHGADPAVMSFPLVQPCDGYLLPVGASPNGGGTYVNQYSIIMDLYYASLSTDPDTGGWAALYQASSRNTDDSEVYIRNDGGVGILGNYAGNVLDGNWHRIGVVVDLTSIGQPFTVYVDGASVTVADDPAMSVDGRFSLGPTILLFTEPNYYTSAGYVNSVQIRNYAMSADEMAALGGPTAAGIGQLDPRPAPDTDLNGHVDQTDLEALLACLTGPSLPLAPGKMLECERFDVDRDGDVDQVDFGKFQEFYTGAGLCGEACYYP